MLSVEQPVGLLRYVHDHLVPELKGLHFSRIVGIRYKPKT